MRRVLDGLVWLCLAAAVVVVVWSFSGTEAAEPQAGEHADANRPEHVARCLSCQYTLGKVPLADANPTPR